jgi:nucleotide-binding universal stress UspA family protein
MFNRVLLATDGSEHSLRAAEKALAVLKGNDKGIVTVLYVVDGNTSKRDVLNYWDSLGIKEKRKAKLKAIADEAIKENIRYEIKIVRGDPARTVIEYTNEHEFDLVVIGSRGLNAFQEMVLGSVSHKVAKRVNCPVMLVK